eukprot:6201679-Pleurochrysis_carterae.AAC.5
MMYPFLRLHAQNDAGPINILNITRFRQVLMTSKGGRFELSSEQRAEEFLISFGLSKAVGNLIAGASADTYGRRATMLLGWLSAFVMSILVLVAPLWEVVVLADLFLGLNQLLCMLLVACGSVWSGVERGACACVRVHVCA